MQLWVRSMQSVFFFVGYVFLLWTHCGLQESCYPVPRGPKKTIHTLSNSMNHSNFEITWKNLMWTNMLLKCLWLILFFGPKKLGPRRKKTGHQDVKMSLQSDGSCAKKGWIQIDQNLLVDVIFRKWSSQFQRLLAILCTGKKHDIFWEILLEWPEKHPSFYPFIPRNLTGFQSFHPPSPNHKLGFA